MNKEVNRIQLIVVFILGISLSAQAQYNEQPSENESKEKEPRSESADDQYYEVPAKFTYSIEGEIHYNDIVQDVDNANVRGELDFHKFAAKSTYLLADQWSVTGKLIVEHSFDSEYGGGDAFIQNLYLKYKHSKNFAIQTGVISVPTSGGKGHYYGSVELSPVEKYLSFAWREAGIGVNGAFGNHMNYKATITTGLDPYELSSKSVIYSARNHRFQKSLKNVATGLQVYYDNDHGTKVGFSTLYSGLTKSGETSEAFEGSRYAFVEVFGAYHFGYFGTRTVVTYSAIQGIENINEVFHNKVGSAQAGGLLELSYDFSRFIGNKSQNFYTMIRAEYYDSQYRTVGVSDNSKYEHYDYTLGLIYQPTKVLEFKADYQIQRFGGKYSSQMFDLSVGFHF